jgi:hypothetical protein
MYRNSLVSLQNMVNQDFQLENHYWPHMITYIDPFKPKKTLASEILLLPIQTKKYYMT